MNSIYEALLYIFMESDVQYKNIKRFPAVASLCLKFHYKSFLERDCSDSALVECKISASCLAVPKEAQP